MAVSTGSPTSKGTRMQFWATERRGAVEVATFSNPPYNYLNKPVIDELEQLVVQWRDPSIRAVVIQSRDEDAMQSDDAQLALKTFIAVDPDARRDWFESENSKNYPAYAGH